MKIVKGIISVLPLLSVNLITARGKTTTTQEPYRAPISQPQQQPQVIIPKQQIDLSITTYSDILRELKKKTPDSSDISTLNNIRNEAQRQIDIIQKKSTPTSSTKSEISGFALQASIDEIMMRHSIPFSVSDDAIRGAWLGQNDLFNEQQVMQQEGAVKNIVREVRQKYPNIDKQKAINAIMIAIQKNQDFKNLKNRMGNIVIKGIDKIKPSLYNDIIERIKEIIEENWQ